MQDAILDSEVLAKPKSKRKLGVLGFAFHGILLVFLLALIPAYSDSFTPLAILAYVPVLTWVFVSASLFFGSLFLRRKTWPLHLGMSLGILIWGTGFALPFGKAGSESELKVVSLNVLRGDIDLEEFAQWVKSEDIDVIALQETNKRDGSDFGVELAEKLGRWNVVHAGETALLSHYAFQNEGQEQIPARYPRYLVWADLKVKGEEVRVISAHWTIPQFSGNPLSLPKRVAYSDGQKAVAVSKTLGLAEDANENVILMGDFNTPPTHSFYRHVEADLNNAWSGAGFGWGLTYGAGKPLGRIDHIWLSDSTSVVSIDVVDGFGSDHKSLVAEIAFD